MAKHPILAALLLSTRRSVSHPAVIRACMPLKVGDVLAPQELLVQVQRRGELVVGWQQAVVEEPSNVIIRTVPCQMLPLAHHQCKDRL